MNKKLLEMRIGVVIWDIVTNYIDKECPELNMMTLKEREDIYGSCVKGVAEMILDDAIERAQEVTDELQQDYEWGVYTPDESDRKLTYEEASRGY